MSKPPPSPDASTSSSGARLGPPRPEAIATLLTTDDFLPGAQTLLYSIKENLSKSPEGEYEPELIVLATPSVSERTRSALHPAFCTRIVEVDPLPFPRAEKISDGTAASHVDTWDRHCGLTKLHIFRLEQYRTLLYIDADCLVVRDVRHLLRLGEESANFDQRSGSSSSSSSSSSLPRSLLGAAPDIMPPDKFNAGVLVVRPSRAVFDDILARAPTLGSYDGGDTGLLNAYFPDWYRSFPPEARLPFGCNAQRFMHRCTYDKRPQYWDEAVGNDLAIVHFSSSSKPWEGASGGDTDGDGDGDEKEGSVAKQAIRAMLDSEDAKALAESGASGGRQLDEMWRKWHDRSRKYARKFEREKRESDEKLSRAEDRAQRRRQEAAPPAAAPAPPPQQSKQQKVKAQRSMTKRFRELRKEGMSAAEAMAKARKECGFAEEDEQKDDPGAKVAAMFGM